MGLLISTFLFVSFFLYNLDYFDQRIFRGVIPLLIMVPIIELFRNEAHPIQNIGLTFLGIVYICLPFSVLNFMITPFGGSDGLYSSIFLIALFLTIWANDTGAYLLGSWLGKTKMFERISPNKTWEGAIGGAFVAIVVSIVYFHFKGSINLFHAAVLGLLTVVAGTLGDLTESMVKRNANVKDSGAILPGHGGLFDRFDSMLFAAPIYYVYLSFVLN
jgi:phosphatidate cytidylyltransferase